MQNKENKGWKGNVIKHTEKRPEEPILLVFKMIVQSAMIKSSIFSQQTEHCTSTIRLSKIPNFQIHKYFRDKNKYKTHKIE